MALHARELASKAAIHRECVFAFKNKTRAMKWEITINMTWEII